MNISPLETDVGRKICSKCRKPKLPSEFNNLLRGRFGLTSWCKGCMNENDKTIRRHNTSIHTTEFYKSLPTDMKIICFRCKKVKSIKDFNRDRDENRGFDFLCRICRSRYASKIYSNIKYRCKKNNIPLLFESNEFRKWYMDIPKICIYCGIHEQYLTLINYNSIYISTPRRTRLEINRIDNNQGYIIDNLNLACQDCNQLHKGPIDHQATLQIAKKYLTPQWVKQIIIYAVNIASNEYTNTLNSQMKEQKICTGTYIKEKR